MKIGIRLLALLASGSVACTSAPRALERAQDSVRVQAPGPGDSLAKLSRRLLTDPDPAAVAQALMCEHGRLGRLYGPEESHRIAVTVADTIYGERDREAVRRVEATLAGHVFDVDCRAEPGDTTP